MTEQTFEKKQEIWAQQREEKELQRNKYIKKTPLKEREQAAYEMCLYYGGLQTPPIFFFFGIKDTKNKIKNRAYFERFNKGEDAQGSIDYYQHKLKVAPNYFSPHEGVNKEGTIICMVCEKTFLNLEEAREHAKTHEVE